MQNKMGRAALAASALATLLALGGCDQVENTEMPQRAQPSVEINRSGMEGAAKETAADADRGAKPIPLPGGASRTS
jgi:hypothetical protein